MSLILSILENFLGDHKNHNESTGQVSFDCPACSIDKGMPEGDGKGNLEVNYNKDVFKCWACKETNDMFGPISKLIFKYGNNKILKDYKLLKPDFEQSDKSDSEEKIITLPEGFRLLKDCTSKDYKYNLVINYLKSRGITDEIIDEFNIGYTTIGKYFNRVIIPSYDEHGLLNYFIARWFDKKKTKLKYLNPDVDKSSIIFNEKKVNWDATIYIVEGVTDHIVVPNSIPLLGKYIPDILFNKLQEKASSNVIIFLDGDAKEDAKILFNKLNSGNLSDKVKICVPPENLDPSKINEEFGKNGIISMLKKSRKLTMWE